MDVAIIGGGASGLVCAIKASKNNKVTIYEKNNKCGKKILITGNGKCNYFNDNFTIDNYNSSNIDILSTIINPDNKDKILNFFDSIGIIPKVVNGYYYPVTNQAITIKEALVNEAFQRGVKFVYDEEIKNIEYINNKFILNNKYEFNKVVLATGSMAAPNTGSDGIGYEFSKKFNHSVIKPLPALVQLKGNEKFFKDWAGIRTDVIVSQFENNKKIDQQVGEIQLTNYGVSGICIFQLSSKIIRGIELGKNEKVYINFLPWLDSDFIEFMDNRNNIMNNRNISELLDGLLNYKLVNLILKLCNINSGIKYSELTITEKNKLKEKFTCFKLDIVDYNGFDSSQVCSGGVPLNEININTFESLIQTNLYIIGELLDVDGRCGGYNLGFAWLSGMICGDNL